MQRTIIKIDESKCNGCGICVDACHEGALALIDGKAVLTREDYCDGLGDCLPACPTGAITFEDREAPAYDEAAVLSAKAKKTAKPLPGGCPGSRAAAIKHPGTTATAPTAPTAGGCPGSRAAAIKHPGTTAATPAATTSQLSQWPVQIKLVPVNAPYFHHARLLIAADCTAYAYGNFHNEFIQNHITLIGCPKLDEGDYSEKLTAILNENEIESVTIVRMEVPCCAGIAEATRRALMNSGKFIPWRIVTISTDGRRLE